MKTISLILSLFIFTAYTSAGQTALQKPKSSPFVLGLTDNIYSKQLTQNRVLNIYLPEGYDTSSQKYPVIYLLDGSANEDFIHIVGLVQFLNMIEAMPQSIVVGIANIDRRHDLTFPTKNKNDLKQYPTTGGSEKFMDFVEKDLQPYIESHYKVNGQKTIIGQSLGGLFATEVLIKRPALFNNYIIVSPSFWWDDESLLEIAPALLKSLPQKGMKIYITVGNEGEQMEGDAKKLVNILQSYNYPDTKIYFQPMPDENHLTILHNAVYKAFEMLNKK